jgi:hypothetical protein
MTAYLISTGALPFTGADLCAELGIDPARFAPTIEAMITVEACNSAKPVLASVWRVSDDEHFESAKRHGGIEPYKVSEPFEYRGETYRDCTYVAHPHTVAMIRTRVLAKARNTDDRELLHAIMDAEARAKVEAHDVLRAQLVAAVELGSAA